MFLWVHPIRARLRAQRAGFLTGNSPRTRTVTRWIPYLLVALPVAIGFSYVYLFGVNVVWRDEWHIVTLLHKLSSGRLTVLDLWEPHNEHRFFFPRVAILLLAVLTKWNTIAEMYLIQGCLLITLIVLLLALRASVGPRTLFFVPVAFLVFSLVQGSNMLWGLQLTFIFVVMFGVLTFFFLYLSGREDLRRFVFPAALVSGTIAAFSAVQGLLVWPAGLLQLFALPLEKPKKKLLIAIWSSIGLVVWIVYFINYETDSISTSVLDPLTHPIAGTRYFLTLLGSSLVSPGWDTLRFGTGLLLASLVAVSVLLIIYKSRRVGEYSFWMGLLLFSLLVLMAITAGRFDGADHMPPSRYANFAILAVVGVYGMLARSVLEDRSHAVVALFSTLCVVVLLSTPASYYEGIREGRRLENHKEQAAFVLYTYRSQPDECLTLVRKSNAHTVRRLAPELERRGYNVFSEPPVSRPPRLRCTG